MVQSLQHKRLGKLENRPSGSLSAVEPYQVAMTTLSTITMSVWMRQVNVVRQNIFKASENHPLPE